MLEHVSRRSESSSVVIDIDVETEPGQWINERGAEALQGVVLVSAGTRLDAGDIAALAMTGHSTVNVFARPTVAVLASGDEIVEIAEQPQAHQIRNSNSYMLAALVASVGGNPQVLPVARDTKDALRPLLQRGLQSDMLIVTGGVSAGRYDLVKPVLRELGVDFHFERVRIQPGGPCAFGIFDRRPVFGLPGNPGSSYITFQLFAEYAIALLSGERDPILPLLTARLGADFRHRLGLTRFLPARLELDGQTLTHIRWQGSSDVPAIARANAFLVAEHDRECWQAGDLIRMLRKL
jgi:molybdopterin molybdotransferase